jgi:hypothetical protein
MIKKVFIKRTFKKISNLLAMHLFYNILQACMERIFFLVYIECELHVYVLYHVIY